MHQQGRLEQAEALYQEILQSQPQHFDAMQLLATIAAQRKDSARAVELFDGVLRINPDHAESHNNRGNTLLELKRPEEALASYERALALKPDHAEAFNNRGNALLELKRPEDALASFERALALKPDHADALNNRGNALRELKRPDEALASYERALALRPDHVDALNNRGIALRNLKRPEEALASFERALALKPDHAEALNNRGNALRDLKRPEDALASYGRALALKPDYSGVLNNRGNALLELTRPEEALASYERALALRPDYAEAHWNESLWRLLMGDFEGGWQKFEWRWKSEQFKGAQRTYPQPLWLGETPLAGKTLLLHAEQGFGDTIQFCRYAPLLAAQGARIVLEVPPALKSLCRSVSGVDTLLAAGEALPPFDFHTPLMSLPLALDTRLDSIPADVPYLHADPARIEAWRELLGEKPRPRIGIAWSGSPTHKNDHNRSIPFALLAELIDDTAEFICLHKEFRDGDEQRVRAHGGVRIVKDKLKDFADTAALIETLDMVITVDTSVAHLAGALGKPVWILLPFAPDWRWLLDREDSPWYPSARLFRQPQFGAWEPVMVLVRQALEPLFGKPGGGSVTPASKADQRSATGTPAPVLPRSDPTRELERRHAAIEAKQTDLVRWSDPGQLEPAWERRSEFVAGYIMAGARVLDLGCGAMTLERHLPFGCTYLPCDIVARDPRTRVCDLNRGEYPDELLSQTDVVTMLGVVEYLYNVPELLCRLRSAGTSLLISYCPSDTGLAAPRRNLGWVNSYTREEFATQIKLAGFHLRRCDRIDGVQWLFHATVDAPAIAPPPKRVLVLSYNNVGNFGDRLGYHLIHSILPPQAIVTHANFKPWNVPTDEFDLLVLGIGNSLFAPLLTDELLALLDRIPRKIGIFGTQYRADFPAHRLQAVLDRLDHWYARYEEDVLLYGRGHENVTHLGDWLIGAFPMATGKDERILRIGQEVWQDLPLDRTIQKIQAHRKVHSTRLHPLLCALTSAEAVAYVEQREDSTGRLSGKFRSMLLDIFGLDMPEEKFWDVDRDAVQSYKLYVMRQTCQLQAALSETLLK